MEITGKVPFLGLMSGELVGQAHNSGYQGLDECRPEVSSEPPGQTLFGCSTTLNDVDARYWPGTEMDACVTVTAASNYGSITITHSDHADCE